MPDVFISFAHINDQPLFGAQQGWVSQFFNNLRAAVDARLGRADPDRWWKDFRLKGSDEVTPAIENELKSVQVLVVLMSHGWLASEWCQRELRLFAQQLSSPAGRVFVVELDEVGKDQQPVLLRDLRAYHFWQNNDKNKVRRLEQQDAEYRDRLTDLAEELADAIRRKNQISAASQPSVYLASVARSLRESRARLASELAQFGIRVLPTDNVWQEAALAEELAQCSLFVQLLDDDDAMGVPSRQQQLAKQSGKPIVQWRADNTPAPDDVPASHRALLQGSTVTVSTLTDFGRMLRERLLPKVAPTPSAKTGSREMVFVHAHPEDMEPARHVAGKLKSAGYNIALPRYEGDANLIHETIQRGYHFCNTLLMVHRTAPALRVEENLAEAFDSLQQRQPAPPMLICQDAQAEELLFVPPDVVTLSCGERFDATCLDNFLAETKSHGDAK